MSENDDEGGGYGRPPKHSRFKPGQSGNPNGRPRRRRRAFMNEFERQLYRQVTSRGPDGKEQKVELISALAITLLNNALKGKSKALTIVLGLMERLRSQQDRKNLTGVLAVHVPSFEMTPEAWGEAVRKAEEKAEAEMARLLDDIDEDGDQPPKPPAPPPKPKPLHPKPGGTRVKKSKPK